MRDVVGLVLAAGAGRRMGGPKALLRTSPTGPTFVESAVTRLYAAGLATVVVVTGAAGDEVAQRAVSAGARVIACPDWAQGMGASLRTGLDLLTGEHPRAGAVLIALVDLPDVDERVHRRVLAAATGDGALGRRLVRAAYDGVPGHPVVIGADHWPPLLTMVSGDRGARDYLATAEVTLVECGDLATGRDADRPTDL